MAVLTSCMSSPNLIKWVAPDKMLINDGDEDKIYKLLKGAEDELHSKIDYKVSASKELFKKATDLWNELISTKLDSVALNFELDGENVIYFKRESTASEIIDIFDAHTTDLYNELVSRHDKFVLDITTSKVANKIFTIDDSDIWKFIFYDKSITDVEEHDYISIVLLELNFKKSNYVAYCGIYIPQTQTIFLRLGNIISRDRYGDLVYSFDLVKSMEMADECSSDLYENYKSVKSNPEQISVRELVSILKTVGYKLEIDDVGDLMPIKKIYDDDNNQKLLDYFNTFKFTTGESAWDIYKLTSFKQTFKYNKLTMLEVLEILSKEYLLKGGDKITGDLLMNLGYRLFDKVNLDIMQVKSLEESK